MFLIFRLDTDEEEEEEEKSQSSLSLFPLPSFFLHVAMRPYLLKGHSRPLTQLKCVSFRSLWLRNKAAASKSRQSRRWQKRLCLSPLFAHAHKLKSTFLIDHHTHRFNLEGDLLFSCGKVKYSSENEGDSFSSSSLHRSRDNLRCATICLLVFSLFRCE